MSDINFTKAGSVATIQLNRPAKKNSFTLDMIDQWANFLEDLEQDRDVLVLILTGSGGSFCAGADLGHLAPDMQTPIARKRLLEEQIQRIPRAMGRLACISIAAVSGPAVGAGMDMALMCDLRFADSTARLSEGYIRLGLVPGDGGCYYLPRIVGTSKALELAVTGEFVDAHEAHRLGLINRIFEPAELSDATEKFAADIAARSPIALRLIKKTIYASQGLDLQASLDMVSSHMAVVQSTDDYQEAFAAFREKRPGAFTNA